MLTAGNCREEEFHRIRIGSIGGIVSPKEILLVQMAVRALAPEAVQDTEATVREFGKGSADSLRCLKLPIGLRRRLPPTFISVLGATASTNLCINSSAVAIG